MQHAEYEIWIQRDEELDRSREAKVKRELLGEFVDIETGCPWDSIEEPIPLAVETDWKEAA